MMEKYQAGCQNNGKLTACNYSSIKIVNTEL